LIVLVLLVGLGVWGFGDRLSSALPWAGESTTWVPTQPEGGAQPPSGDVIRYSVRTNGQVSTSLEDFSAKVAETLNDEHGWKGAGVSFEEVDNSDTLVIVLSEADLLPTFDEECTPQWSCRVGVFAVINDNLWSQASAAWNDAGLSLRDYQHMVINHEVGHLLGHFDNESTCAAPGDPAPLMQQQSMDLQGCTFNPWPLPEELWVNLG
jgi:hypothetical protein